MKVVGAIGTLPARAESLVHTLRSIARQTMPLDALTIFGDRYTLPQLEAVLVPLVRELPFEVCVMVGDVGVSSKYHAALRAMGFVGPSGADAVAFFDDDIDYDPKHVELSVALIRALTEKLETPKVRVGPLAEIVTKPRIPSWNAKDVRNVQFPFGPGRRLTAPLEVHNLGVGMMTASWEAAESIIPPLVAASPRLGCEPFACGVAIDAGVRSFALPVDGPGGPLRYSSRRHAWMSHTARESRESLDAYAREVEWPPLPLPTQPHRGRERRAARLARRGITRT